MGKNRTVDFPISVLHRRREQQVQISPQK